MADNRHKNHLMENTIPIASLLQTGYFQLFNLEEAYALARFFSKVYPNPPLAKVGISELLINAIEHGNLGIDAEEKSKLQHENRWLSEINRRLRLPQYKNKIVNITFEYSQKSITLIVEDQGQGFNWRTYMEDPTEVNLKQNGRGILMAKNLVFTTLSYSEKGNTVKAIVHLNPDSNMSK